MEQTKKSTKLSLLQLLIAAENLGICDRPYITDLHAFDYNKPNTTSFSRYHTLEYIPIEGIITTKK